MVHLVLLDFLGKVRRVKNRKTWTKYRPEVQSTLCKQRMNILVVVDNINHLSDRHNLTIAERYREDQTYAVTKLTLQME